MLLTECADSEVQDDNIKNRKGGSIAPGVWMSQNVTRVISWKI